MGVPPFFPAGNLQGSPESHTEKDPRLHHWDPAPQSYFRSGDRCWRLKQKGGTMWGPRDLAKFFINPTTMVYDTYNYI